MPFSPEPEIIGSKIHRSPPGRSFEFLGGKAKWNGVENFFVLPSFAVSDHFVKIQLIQQDKLGNHYYDLYLPLFQTEVFFNS